MKRTALSMPPGAIIGYHKDGRPIRIVAGGSGEGDPGDSGISTTGQDPGAGNGGAGTGQADSQNTGQSGTGGRTDGGTGSGDSTGTGPNPGPGTGSDDHTARTIAAIRDDFKAERARRQTAEQELAAVKEAQAQLQQALAADKADRQKQLDALAKAMGLKPEDEPPTPEKLAAELADARREAESAAQARQAAEANAAAALAQARRERALLHAAPGLDANGLALLDSRSFMDRLAGLDPAADDFSGKLADAIKAAVESNTGYKATPPKRTAPPATSSGGEFNGQPGGNRQWTDADVDKATPREIQEAAKAGLLRDLGVGQPRVKRGYR
jgi:hypothetical protein